MRRRQSASAAPATIGRALVGGICIMALLCGFALAGALVYFKAQAQPSAAPGLSASDMPAHDEEGFPLVDWELWQRINPDIRGWVTVPGTSIDLPIVQAPLNESAFYLTHDIHRNWNYLGCPYLDVECARLGFDSRCAMVYGHNSDDGSMFADFARYDSQAFAEEHARILLQTPTMKRALKVTAVTIVKGSDANNKLHFENDAEFNAWYRDRVKSSFFQLGSMDDETPGTSEGEVAAQPDSVIAFCTCSYNFWPDDERTIIYAT